MPQTTYSSPPPERSSAGGRGGALFQYPIRITSAPPESQHLQQVAHTLPCQTHTFPREKVKRNIPTCLTSGKELERPGSDQHANGNVNHYQAFLSWLRRRFQLQGMWVFQALVGALLASSS